MSEMKEVKRYTRIGLDGAGQIAEYKMVDASDYDALLSEKAALVAELWQTEQAAAEYHCEVERLRTAIAGAREAIEDGYIHLEQDADDAENSSMLTRLRQKTAAKWRASAEQLRALSSIGDLPAGEEG